MSDLGGLWVFWLVCGWLDWFAGGLTGLWVVWLVCGWFRVLQLTRTEVVLNGKSSQEYPVNAAVSPGSILGLTLFLHCW